MTQPLLDHDTIAQMPTPQPSHDKLIRVLGGGVIGLTTALTLQRAPGLTVQLICEFGREH